MKMIKKYQELGIRSTDEAFQYLIENLKDTIRAHDFFVAWSKVLDNVTKVEVPLSILNTLIGKGDIANQLKQLIFDYPEIVPVIPLLIAVRDTKINVSPEGCRAIEYSFDSRTAYTEEEADLIVDFSEKCGLLRILADKSVKNLVDYMVGVEVGLDTNARKNRSGTAMESLAENYVRAICKKHDFKYLAQATEVKILRQFGKAITVDKANRAFDFAIDTGDRLYLIEVNYYGGGGSKLKAVAGEFVSLFNLVGNAEVGFIWVTDGKGWISARTALSETFEKTDHILNLKMIESGLLEEILTKRL